MEEPTQALDVFVKLRGQVLAREIDDKLENEVQGSDPALQSFLVACIGGNLRIGVLEDCQAAIPQFYLRDHTHLEELEEGVGKLAQHEVDLGVEVVGPEKRPPALEDRVGDL